MKRPGSWGQTASEGLPELRHWFALRASRQLNQENVFLVQGGQAALGVAIRSACAYHPTLLVESPTYLGALAVARSSGIRIIPIPSDEQGVRLEFLQEAFEKTGAKAFYCQPLYANPTGISLSTSRRMALLALARQYGAFIIEDDYARDLSHGGRPAPTLISEDDGHVIYIRSLTKSIAPSLRIAALCAQGPIQSRLRAARLVDDFFIPYPLQATALDFVNTPRYQKHINNIQDALRSRTRVAHQALRAQLPQCTFNSSQGGYSIWLGIPEHLDPEVVCLRARQLGVIVTPGKDWFAGEELGNYLRLSIAGLKEDAIFVAIDRLTHAFIPNIS